MRLDKFLWTVRLYKTRTLASKDCGTEKVMINDETAKGSKLIKTGDEVAVKANPIWRRYQIMDIPKSRISAKLIPEYIREITSEEDLKTLEGIQLANRQQRQSGIKGRPTKKDRRNLIKYKH